MKTYRVRQYSINMDALPVLLAIPDDAEPLSVHLWPSREPVVFIKERAVEIRKRCIVVFALQTDEHEPVPMEESHYLGSVAPRNGGIMRHYFWREAGRYQ